MINTTLTINWQEFIGGGLWKFRGFNIIRVVSGV